jgi:hypothetical protein
MVAETPESNKCPYRIEIIDFLPFVSDSHGGWNLLL